MKKVTVGFCNGREQCAGWHQARDGIDRTKIILYLLEIFPHSLFKLLMIDLNNQHNLNSTIGKPDVPTASVSCTFQSLLEA